MLRSTPKRAILPDGQKAGDESAKPDDPGKRDLIVSWVKMSEIEPARRREHLSRALGIARSLHDEGRLAPVDAWMVDDLTQRLGEL